MALPTLLAGEMPDATKWADILSYLPREVRMGGDQALTASSTTLQNVTSLVLSVSANMNYQGRLVIAAANASGTVEDVKYGFTFPAGANIDWYPIGPNVNLASATATDIEVGSHVANSGSTAAFGTVSGGTYTHTIIEFSLQVAGTAGNLQVQAAQNTSGVNVITVRLGSFLTMQRVG